MKEGSAYRYTADDLQRYSEGKMSSSEMHAIEKAALEDPFLADALEGIREMRPNLKEDLMEMQNKLSEKEQEKPVKVKRWVIALAILLLLSLSFGGWLMFREDGSPQLAQGDGTGTPAATVPATVAGDSAGNADMAQAENKQDEAIAPTPATSAKPADAAGAKTATTEKAKQVQPSAAPPVASVSTAAAEPSESKKSDESAKTAKAAPSKATTEAKLQADVKEAEAAPTAVKSKGNNNYETLEMAKNVEPAIGWSAFAKYIASNMQRPAGGLHGTVGTNFIVAPDGSISDVRVVKSLHPDYDKEAIRLLQNGPKWKVSNGEKPVKAVYNLVF